MKNGLIFENGEWIFYRNDNPYHAGAVEVDGDIYYIGRHGRVVTGEHVVHSEMANGVLKHGTYTFGEDGKLIKGSYIAPKKHSSKRKKKKKASHRKRSVKISKKTIGLLAGFFATVLTLFVCAVIVDSISRHHTEPVETTPSVSITLPEFEEPVLLCSEAALKLYNHELTMADMKGVTPYVPMQFKYSLSGSDGLLYISEYADMSNPREYVLVEDKKEVTIDNLKTGTVYYYTVYAGEEVHTGSFETAEGTRYIYIPGVYNTRDIGGYTTLDGKVVKQGMIIRGTEIDGLVEANYFLKQEDRESVQKQFGFVYEMDLREYYTYSDDYVSRLGEGVEHNFYTSPMYGNIFSEINADKVKTIFSDLADPRNYPMYLHCTYGCDRTGTIVYLLQGILNMPEEDMMREYQMSAFFSTQYTQTSRMEVVIEGLEKYEGDTVQEKIESFLIEDIGVTKKEIESIRSILLED